MFLHQIRNIDLKKGAGVSVHVLQNSNPFCLSRLGGEGEGGGGGVRTSAFGHVPEERERETGYALCIIADVSGSKTRSQLRREKGKLFRASDGNEPIFSELEPDSSLETSSSSFYRAEPVLHNNLTWKNKNIAYTSFTKKDRH